MTMTYEEDAGVAQRVLQALAYPGSPPDVRGAQVQIAGETYSVHRHDADLRFNQQTGRYPGQPWNFLIVEVGEHTGGWMLARTKRPPGEYHDARAAEAARSLVERALVWLGYGVGTGGPGGRRKTAAELEADVRAFLECADPLDHGEEDAGVAQRVLQALAYPGPPPDVRGAQVQIAGETYSVHRHGADLRFNQQTGRYPGQPWNFLIVAVGEHVGGWMLARVVRLPGEYHDARAAEAARSLVERALVRLGYGVDTGSAGVGGIRLPSSRSTSARSWARRPLGKKRSQRGARPRGGRAGHD